MVEKIKAVGFDLDGTLYIKTKEIDDIIQEYIIKEASKLLKRPIEEVRVGFLESYRQTQSGSTSLNSLGIKEGKNLVQEAVEYADIASVLKTDRELSAILTDLSCYYKLFLITSSPENAALSKLNALGIEDKIFQSKIYGESIYIRDDGSAFRYIANLFNIKLEEMMFIGDREKTDIVPASNLGITTAIVNNHSKLAAYNLKNIYQLREILLK